MKNYKRPNGLATQVFDTQLIGYTKSLEADNFFVATQKSSNRNLLRGLVQSYQT